MKSSASRIMALMSERFIRFLPNAVVNLDLEHSRADSSRRMCETARPTTAHSDTGWNGKAKVGLRFHLGPVRTEQHCQEYDGRFNDQLGIRVEIQQRHSIRNHAHENNPDQCPPNLADTSCETGATDDHRRDYVQ